MKMLRLTMLIGLLGIFANSTHAQQTYFNKLYNNNGWWDFSTGIVHLGNHYLVAGNSRNLLATDSTYYSIFWLFYADSLGNKGLEKKIRFNYSSAFTANINPVEVTDSNGFVITGQLVDSNGYSRAILLKLDSSLNMVWFVTDTGKGFCIPNGIVQLPDGGWMVYGSSSVTRQSTSDGFLMRVSKEGVKLWMQYYGDSRDDNFINTVVLDDSTLLVSGGSVDFSGGSSDFSFVMKLDITGNVINKKILATSNTGLKIKQSAYHGYIVCGSMSDDQFNRYGVVGKFNENFEFLWKDSLRPFDQQSNFQDLVELPGGNIIVVGYTENKNGPYTVGWVAKFNVNGGLIKEKLYLKNDGRWSSLASIILTKEYNILAVGDARNDYDPTPYGQDTWLIKLDTNLCDTPNCFPKVGIETTPAEIGISCYPNPFTNELTLLFPERLAYKKINIRLYNTQGLLVTEIKDMALENNKYILDTHTLPPNLYLIEVTCQNEHYAVHHKAIRIPN